MVDAAALIVGRGPTGLIVAQELLRRSISRRLVDFSLLLLAGDAAKDPVIEGIDWKRHRGFDGR